MRRWYEVYQKVEGDLTLSLDKADTLEEANVLKDDLEAVLQESLFIDEWIEDEKGTRRVSKPGRKSRSVHSKPKRKTRQYRSIHEEVEDLVWS